jgi:hypothetical protein
MTTGTIGAWIKKPGDKCEPGETIAEIETGKLFSTNPDTSSVCESSDFHLL